MKIFDAYMLGLITIPLIGFFLLLCTMLGQYINDQEEKRISKIVKKISNDKSSTNTKKVGRPRKKRM